MIQINPLPEPLKLTQECPNWTNELCNERRNYYIQLEEFNNGTRPIKPEYPKPKKTWYAHKDIKKQLRNMFGPKCAYCESHVTGNSYLHVEHFRPSSIYPSLAYQWNNFLLACEVCNSGCKKAQFPLMDGSHPVEHTIDPCSLDDSDDNALINPCFENPDQYFDFLNEKIICRPGRIKAIQTRDVCGLNREDLKDARKGDLILFELGVITYKHAKKRKDLNMVTRSKTILNQILTNPKTPFIAMLKAKLKRMKVDINELV